MRQEAAAVYQPGSPPSAAGGTIGLVRRLLTWAVVTLGIAAVARRLRRRGRSHDGASDDAAAPADEAGADEDPAEELRRRLAASRAGDEAEAGSPASAAPATADERRAGVHEQGRAALDEMRKSSEE